MSDVRLLLFSFRQPDLFLSDLFAVSRNVFRLNFRKLLFAFPNDCAPGSGAGDGTRTRNLLITNQLLCQLSYASQKTIER